MTRGVCVALLLLVMTSGGAQAQEAYPTPPITIGN